MQPILQRIYGKPMGDAVFQRLSAVLASLTPAPLSTDKALFTPADAVLITYGDTLCREGEPPLKTLRGFANEHFKGIFSGIHILPFFPYSSDDGFSIMDFQAVRADLGNWADVQAIGRDFKLMVDLVANHVSSRSRWFQSYLAEEKGFERLAIEVDPHTDLSAVIRPRALPLLTAFDKHSGRRVHVWTTFSADQIDLNYKSPAVLEKMLRVLLFYVSRGARIIRLDAIAYLWKEIGTACIHLPQTHDMVRLFRRILDRVAPGTVLITETNVPHEENTAYFGDGGDEAHMVYNFTLPPLLLYSLATGSARLLSDWARSLVPPSPLTAFLNFTASHDGIGVRPLEGILPASRIAWLADRVRRNGGQVSEKRNPDGSRSPYELNVTYLDALRNPDLADDPLHIARFLASQAVALALAGVPAVYIHSLLGSTNWSEGVRLTGRARTINRARLSLDDVDAELDDRHSRRARIFHPYLHMLRTRCRQPAFHPAAGMRILFLDDRVFALRRSCPQQTIHALTNLSADALTVRLPYGKDATPTDDLLSGDHVDGAAVRLGAYQTRWLSG